MSHHILPDVDDTNFCDAVASAAPAKEVGLSAAPRLSNMTNTHMAAKADERRPAKQQQQQQPITTLTYSLQAHKSPTRDAVEPQQQPVSSRDSSASSSDSSSVWSIEQCNTADADYAIRTCAAGYMLGLGAGKWAEDGPSDQSTTITMPQFDPSWADPIDVPPPEEWHAVPEL